VDFYHSVNTKVKKRRCCFLFNILAFLHGKSVRMARTPMAGKQTARNTIKHGRDPCSLAGISSG
jgi:hypothetical protein